MNIAVPSNDGILVSAHFGRSKGFLVFETHNQEITKEEYRPNEVTGHAHGAHHEHVHGHSHTHSPGEHPHSHSGILDVLNDCEAVIAGGMGNRLYIDFQVAGKKVYITHESNAREAVLLLLQNKLDNNPETCCQH